MDKRLDHKRHTKASGLLMTTFIAQLYTYYCYLWLRSYMSTFGAQTDDRLFGTNNTHSIRV